jgi:hypothetical protein
MSEKDEEQFCPPKTELLLEIELSFHKEYVLEIMAI